MKASEMRDAILAILITLLSYSTSGQQYPNCGIDCSRDGEYIHVLCHYNMMSCRYCCAITTTIIIYYNGIR